MAEMLSGDAAVARLRELAPRSAQRGDSTALRHLQQLDERAALQEAELPAGSDLTDPSTWEATIYDSWLMAELQGDRGYVYAGMEHNGHQGIIKMEYQISALDGSWSREAGPYRAGDFNPMGKHRRSSVHLLQSVYPPSACGYTIRANADYIAFYHVLPLPFEAGPVTVPLLSYGHARVDRYSNPDNQQPCPPGTPTSGSGGGGGDGSWATVTECWGYHVYSNGIYQYSVIEGCHSYSIFIRSDGGGNWT